MASASHHLLHRMVPLICQALTASPSDETVWLEGLRLLADPKLRTAMSITSSIWLPLLIRGLEAAGPKEVTMTALKLLVVVTEIIEPIKSCLVKPLRALAKEPEISGSDELAVAVTKLGILVYDDQKRPIGKTKPQASLAGSHPNTPLVNQEQPEQHPLLEEILSRNLPAKLRSVGYAWTQTLLMPAEDSGTSWLQSLYQATLEASEVKELIITSRLGTAMHEEMFQTAFVKCYQLIEDDAAFKATVDQAIVNLIVNEAVGREIHVVFLELLAFLHKEWKGLPEAMLEAGKKCAISGFIGNGDLGEPIPAIVVWYAELEAERSMTPESIADLVEVNIRSGSSGYDSAWSSLLWLRDDYQVEPDPMWITQLGHWDTALEAQDKADGGKAVTTFGSFNTRMICHHALGEFERGYQLAQDQFEGLNDYERRKTSHWAAASAWHMGDYEMMADYLAFHPRGTSKSLYKAITDVYHGQYASAFHHISKAQSLSYDELQTQLGAGPQVALKTLAKTEFLVELQEVIQFKSQPDIREHTLNVWRARFKRSHDDANTWMKRLKIWTLACPPSTPELLNCYIDCAKLCESNGMQLAARNLLDMVTPAVTPPGCKVEYTRLRFLWKNAYDSKDEAAMRDLLDRLQAHTTRFFESIGIDREAIESEGLGLRPLSLKDGVPRKMRNGLARRMYRIGQWTEAVLGPEWINDPENEVFRYYSVAYKMDNIWAAGSYALADAAMSIFESNGYRRSDAIAVNNYIVPAVRGLFQAVQAQDTPEKMIKSLLRLVTIWFRYGESDSVLIEVEHQLVTTPINSWLMAIPQLIARLGTQHKPLQGVLVDLLKNIASHFPHAVIWPLLTASQTRKKEHEEAARVIMDYICSMPDGTRLVNQAELVGRELIRVSISWLEKWRNIIDKCLPRNDLMEVVWHEVPAIWQEEMARLAEPETRDEEYFVQKFGHQLQTINKTLIRYRSTRQIGLVNAAYSDLYKLYGEIDAQINQWRMPGSKIQLVTAAPRLLSLRDCILTVPGQYDPGIKLDDQAFIDAFQPSVDVLASKQLPRKLIIRSYSDDFTFLLKGNEDLRGDERIMQLFTLINTLLNHEQEAFGRNLHLLPYEVIPLSPSAGLVSWVPNTQQLQSMIQANRDKDKSKSLTNKELASLLGYDPETFNPHGLDAPAEMDRYDKLSLDKKVERLENALSHSKQTDLRDVLWQRSPSAEIWLRRRTNFARTIGVGSFVGHIIGLGDRHGSNILVDQLTWGALHIDFGDLFGIAQERSFLPEKVPFRLTRMMTNAFELASHKGGETPGSRGSFKQASIVTMGVLRDNRSSLLAMLEAFLYDPLLSWTVNTTPSEARPSADPAASARVTKPKPSTTVAPTHTLVVPQSIAPGKGGQAGSKGDVFDHINNSLISEYLDTDSYMAKVSSAGMTNKKALQVLAQIERKLAGYNSTSEQPLAVKKQVQELVEQATDLQNLSQGYVLGWIPHW